MKKYNGNQHRNVRAYMKMYNGNQHTNVYATSLEKKYA